jgi:hypothetical protein
MELIRTPGGISKQPGYLEYIGIDWWREYGNSISYCFKNHNCKVVRSNINLGNELTRVTLNELKENTIFYHLFIRITGDFNLTMLRELYQMDKADYFKPMFEIKDDVLTIIPVDTNFHYFSGDIKFKFEHILNIGNQFIYEQLNDSSTRY